MTPLDPNISAGFVRALLINPVIKIRIGRWKAVVRQSDEADVKKFLAHNPIVRGLVAQMDSPAGGVVASSLPSPLPEDKLTPGSHPNGGRGPLRKVPGGAYQGSGI